ncbi:hypothetical protein GCM10011380_12800 [Sphingomonas metalli]|uniref:DUF4142 domain-containing protein n=2 Tax=Sphingomonas metalli TaxID=1779358 RepID=A0A916SZZ9_9SPHN|nr:hypothetical protein GCM10011380_12800 [Sphingomonas metalli]
MRFLTPMAATLLVAAPAVAQTVSPATYVAKAGASDRFEMESSRLVLGSTKDPKVRDFANQMIADHTQSTQQVKAAAKQAGITVPPPKLEPMQAKNVAELRRATGTARDQLYMQQQRTAHQMALDLHQGYAQNGSSAPLKAVAAQITPVVQSHMQHLTAM